MLREGVSIFVLHIFHIFHTACPCTHALSSQQSAVEQLSEMSTQVIETHLHVYKAIFATHFARKLAGPPVGLDTQCNVVGAQDAV